MTDFNVMENIIFDGIEWTYRIPRVNLVDEVPKLHEYGCECWSPTRMQGIGLIKPKKKRKRKEKKKGHDYVE